MDLNSMSYNIMKPGSKKQISAINRYKNVHAKIITIDSLFDLPANLLIDQIILYLDIQSIHQLMKINKKIAKFFNEHQITLFKILLQRDFLFFFATNPYHNISLPVYKQDIELIYDTPEQAQVEYQDISKLPFNQLFQEYISYQQTLEFQKKPQMKNECLMLIPYFENFMKNQNLISNHKTNYKQLKSLPNHSGVYVGDYQAHGLELIYVFQYGYELYAVKMTGDANVPENKVTWKMHLDKSMNKGKGYIRLAEAGFLNSKWSTAFLEIEEDMLIIRWYYEFNGSYYEIAYGNKRADKKVLENQDVQKLISKRKIEQLQLQDLNDANNNQSIIEIEDF